MPFALQELLKAHRAYREFLASNPPAHHARYVFPFFAGSYFAYRKVDVLRTVAVARSISADPTYVDFGCGYGDYLAQVRKYIPGATGVEAEAAIFYAFQVPKPDFIALSPVESFKQADIDMAFVGWMEPGQDFRRAVAKSAKCIITTFDAGGQCGINGGCEYEEFGFERVAHWRTPSWIDVYTELMNRYYTPSLGNGQKEKLAAFRSAHNLWYVYSKEEYATQVAKGLKDSIAKEASAKRDYLGFESVLDEC